jgi:hypothetical protein
MQFTKATRKKCKMKLALQGSSGSGKTYSALLLAKGLTNNLEKVAVIDTENGSSNLYAHLGDFSVLTLQAPFTPEKYTESIEQAQKNGFECIIIDSLSHEWFGAGGILDVHSNMSGNSFTNWAKLTPRHNALMEAIINANLHVIATMRSKTDYVIQNINGKNVPEKVGLKPVQREDSDYEFTIVFELNKNNMAVVSKDRTGLFAKQPELVLSENTGKKILQWCDVSTGNNSTDFTKRIQQCKSIEELSKLYAEFPEHRDVYREHFSAKQEELMLNQFKIHQNGHSKTV